MANDHLTHANDPLASCVMEHTPEVLYNVVHAFRAVEGCDDSQMHNRWVACKSKCKDLVVVKRGRTSCVDEANLLKVIGCMRDCETKTRVLALRGVQTTVRPRAIVLHAEAGTVTIALDYGTQRLPLNETIRVFGVSKDTAKHQWDTITANHPQLAERVGAPIQVNGFGKHKLCADLPTMLEILWLLPTNPRTAAFRVKCAQDVCRQMQGDPTLVAELEHNRAILEVTGAMHFQETAIEPSKPHAVQSTSAQSTPPLPDTTLAHDLLLVLTSAMGIRQDEAIRVWRGLCARHPCFYDLCIENQTDKAYVSRETLVEIGHTEPIVEWATCIVDFLRDSRATEIITKSWTHGSFFPVSVYVAPYQSLCTSSRIVWVPVFTVAEVGICTELDRLLELKFDITLKQATALRSRQMKLDTTLASRAFTHTTSDGRSRWCLSVETVDEILAKFSRKRDAEAERMHEHRLAQTYVQSRLCEVEVQCEICKSVDKLAVCGRRFCEYPWNGFVLDIGIVLGELVVGAVEILNTSVISSKKLQAMRSEGLKWAEVRASEVIAAVRGGLAVVRADRGGGVCTRCSCDETCAILSHRLEELQEMYTQALKRRAEVESDVSEIVRLRIDTRAKLRKLTDTSAQTTSPGSQKKPKG